MFRGRKVRGVFGALLGIAMSVSFAATAPGALAAGRTVKVTPATNLSEGQSVTVTASGLNASAPLVVAECTVGTVDPTTCDVTNFLDAVSTPAGALSTAYTVHLAFINGVGAVIDCRTSACEMLVVDLGSQGAPILTGAPIAFNAQGPNPKLKVTPSTALLDGQTVQMHGTGFTDPNGLIAVLECVTADEAGTCRLLNQTAPVTAAADGTFDVSLPVTRVLHDQQGTRTDCAKAACEIFAVDVTAIVFGARAAIGFDGSVPPPPGPTLAVAPNTNLPFVSTVSATGGHWAAFDPIDVLECGALPADPCDLFTASVALADANGAFTLPFTARRMITDLQSNTRLDCASAPGRCNAFAFDAATGDTVQTSLSFDPNAPVPTPPEMHTSATTDLADRQPIRFDVRHATPGSNISIDLCASTAQLSSCLGASDISGASTVGADGHFATTVIAHRFFATGLDGTTGRARARMHAITQAAPTTHNPFVRARSLGFTSPAPFRWAARAGTALDCASSTTQCSVEVVSPIDEFVASVPLAINAHKTPMPRATLAITAPPHLQGGERVTLDATGVGFLAVAGECAVDNTGLILGCVELVTLNPDAAGHVHRTLVVRRFVTNLTTGHTIDCEHAQCAILEQPGLGSADVFTRPMQFG